MMTDDELVRNLEDLTENAAHHQLQTLHSILQHQASVSYLQPYLSACDAPVDAATFRSRVPLSSYDDYFHLINQLANGDIDHHQPLLSADPLLCFFYSSGTSTMKPKLIPYFDSALSRAASYNAHQGSAAIFRKLVPPRPEVNKVLWFLYADEVTTTRGGFKVMAASTYPLQGNKSRSNWNFDIIDGIRAAYAAGLIRAFSMLESKWEKLCDDLESGFPSLEIADAAMRESVVEFLGGPQVDLSRRIREICAESNWGGILSKLWPNARYVKAVTTGSMKQYYPKLKHYAGDVMILGGDYFASECCLGINLDIQQPPESTRFVMLPTAAYFEFLPFDVNERGVAGEETVDFSGVKVGEDVRGGSDNLQRIVSIPIG
ncbi:INDOLE-3-ACETIC ACID-AMIDO SYNTHETASE GH3.6-RELATED [Salix purpurea]|uniref:INDOLE-3-ACETIC ACID-AMIDO SYNTHETASE GH3.6-RELATED n=1 Tax=Salix purpurea TaxID=77065 RepID=A0A9Q0P298_SALPP|nr:INDOLE-3-ACETIC ACID-AMIDO SYNTHETASE GH3.6-RELATED [Salix purpurea]